MHPRRRSIVLVALLLTACSSRTVSDHHNAASQPPAAMTPPATTGIVTTKTVSATTEAIVATTASPTTVPPTTVPPTTVQPTVASTTTAPTSTTPIDTTPINTTSIATSPTATVVAAQTQSGPLPPNGAPLPVPQAPPGPDVQEGIVVLGSIEIPRLGLNKVLHEGITVPTLNRGPGHWPGTALPGAQGNVVVGGHRTTKGRPFRHLDRLVAGDQVIFTTEAGRFVYRVVQTQIVTPESIWIVDQTPAYTATLFACHPAGSTKERIVVFLELSV